MVSNLNLWDVFITHISTGDENMKNLKLKIKILENYGSQVDFAQTLGICESGVSKIVNGRRLLSPEQKEKWAELLGCNTNIFKGC